jgi:hypothetical protein
MISIAQISPALEALCWKEYAMIKKSSFIIISVILLGLAANSCSLFGPKTGDLEGFEIYFSTDASGMKGIKSERSLSSAMGKAVHFPNNGALGFTKFWFPATATYGVLTTKGTLDNGQIQLKAADLTGLDYYKAIDTSSDDPLILDAASGDPYCPAIDLPYDATYKGIVIEYAFLQVEMDDYTLRYYGQDSGTYKAGDVLIDLNSDAGGWKFLYNKRVFTFDFNYKDHQTPQNNYERIEKVSCDIRLYLSDTRMPAQIDGQKSYYENWKFLIGVHANEEPSYIYDFLSKKDSVRLATYDSNGIYPGEKLVQVFRPSPDYPIEGGSYILDPEAEKGEDTYLRDTFPTHFRSKDPILIVNYGPNSTIEKPYTIETFPGDANEAKMYKLELVYSLGSPDHEHDGLTIQVPIDNWDEADTPSASWSELSAFRNMLNIGPSCGGIGARFGWLDFNDEWQGEFSPGAGQ